MSLPGWIDEAAFQAADSNGDGVRLLSQLDKDSINQMGWVFIV